MIKAGWAVYNAGVEYVKTSILKSGHLPHYLFLEASTPSAYILDDFTVPRLPLQDLCFFLNEEHERACRATKGKIYIVCK